MNILTFLMILVILIAIAGITVIISAVVESHKAVMTSGVVLVALGIMSLVIMIAAVNMCHNPTNYTVRYSSPLINESGHFYYINDKNKPVFIDNLSDQTVKLTNEPSYVEVVDSKWLCFTVDGNIVYIHTNEEC